MRQDDRYTALYIAVCFGYYSIFGLVPLATVIGPFKRDMEYLVIWGNP